MMFVVCDSRGSGHDRITKTAQLKIYLVQHWESLYIEMCGIMKDI